MTGTATARGGGPGLAGPWLQLLTPGPPAPSTSEQCNVKGGREGGPGGGEDLTPSCQEAQI